MTAPEHNADEIEPQAEPADRAVGPMQATSEAATSQPAGAVAPASNAASVHPTNGEAVPPRESTIPTVHIREVRQGHRPGERYVRIRRPFHETFREASGDTLVAREKVYEPRGTVGRFWGQARRVLIGAPLATSQLAHERLPKTKALAVFASDALSSSAYATEEVLRILVLAGAGALALTLPVAGAIAVLLAIVGISYRQTIKAYPLGGGSYI